MKLNKNNIQIITLIISAFALMLTMVSILTEHTFFKYDSVLVLSLAILLVIITGCIYAILIIKRINPKKYIYLSYARADAEVAKKILLFLDEQFRKLSKYRFEILTADIIPFGNDLDETMQKYISKADIVIIIVSQPYLQSEWCQKEFISISLEKKRIIPIVTKSFGDLAKFPMDLSKIKSLSLTDHESEEIFLNKLNILAKDIIRQYSDPV